MQKTFVILGLLALAALDGAALHDILKQNEPDYFAEYAMLAASAVIFAAAGFRWLRKQPAATVETPSSKKP